MADIFQTSISGMLAYQRALATTSHNISNVNTAGFSRQITSFDAREPQFFGGGYIGSGVEVGTIRRLVDQQRILEVRNNSSEFARLETFAGLSGRIDNLLADKHAGLAPAVQSFFSAVQTVATDPVSGTSRQVLLTEAQNLASRFQFFDSRMNQLESDVTARVKVQVAEINQYASSIARLNQDISIALGRAQGEPPNDLMDQRDELLRQLATKINTTTLTQEDGMVNVFIGNGQGLVIGNSANQLGTVRSEFDPQRVEVTFVTSTSAVNITRGLSGGTLGGLLDFRREVLDMVRNQVGQLATSIAVDFNLQHHLGMHYDGGVPQLGADFFSLLPPEVLPRQGITATGLPVVGIDVGGGLASTQAGTSVGTDVTTLANARVAAQTITVTDSDGSVTNVAIGAGSSAAQIAAALAGTPGLTSVTAATNWVTLGFAGATGIQDGDTVSFDLVTDGASQTITFVRDASANATLAEDVAAAIALAGAPGDLTVSVDAASNTLTVSSASGANIGVEDFSAQDNAGLAFSNFVGTAGEANDVVIDGTTVSYTTGASGTASATAFATAAAAALGAGYRVLNDGAGGVRIFRLDGSPLDLQNFDADTATGGNADAAFNVAAAAGSTAGYAGVISEGGTTASTATAVAATSSFSFGGQTVTEGGTADSAVRVGMVTIRLEHNATISSSVSGTSGSGGVFNAGAGADAQVPAGDSSVEDLTGSDYRLLYDAGGPQWILTRLSDNTTTNIAVGATAVVDGLYIDTSGIAGPAAGDSYLIRPTRAAAGSLAVALTRPEQVAAASPVVTGEAVDSTGQSANTGTGRISAATIGSQQNLPLAGAIRLTFDAASNQFIVTGGPGGTLPYNPTTSSAGVEFNFPDYGDMRFTVSGVPADGDAFVIEPSTKGRGDNANALRLAALATTMTMEGGDTTYSEFYGSVVGNVGSASMRANINRDAQKVILDQSVAARDEVSGVNLEEEAANLLRYQQAFQASAQVVTIAKSLFETLLSSVQR